MIRQTNLEYGPKTGVDATRSSETSAKDMTAVMLQQRSLAVVANTYIGPMTYKSVKGD